MGHRVSVVLITFNSERYLRACLAGVAAQSGVETELLVVDNASSDRSVELVRELAPDAGMILNPENRGYCAAANQGIAASVAPFVLLLNPDVCLHPLYLQRALTTLDEAGAAFGSVTGRLLRGKGDAIEPTATIDSLGIRMTRTGRHVDRRSGQPDSTELTPREVFGASGAAAIHRRSFLEDVKVGGETFDESFFAYREDADLAWRGQLFGWKCMLAPEAVAWHVRRVTPERRRSLPAEINMHSVKNRFLLRLKNQGALLAVRNFPFETARDLAVIAAALTIERSSLPAFRWLWQHRHEVLARRREIQGRRKVSDRELARWFGERE